MPKNMSLYCGKPVHPVFIATSKTPGFNTPNTPNPKSLFITSDLSTKLSNFCTQLLHIIKAPFLPVKIYLYPFSTAPTITITTYI
jgi:hypothetical protein